MAVPLAGKTAIVTGAGSGTYHFAVSKGNAIFSPIDQGSTSHSPAFSSAKAATSFSLTSPSAQKPKSSFQIMLMPMLLDHRLGPSSNEPMCAIGAN